MADDSTRGWAVAGRRKKPPPTQNFDEASAQAIEDAENIRGLARTLRSKQVNRLIDSGFEYVGVLRGCDDIAPAVSRGFTYANVPVLGNRWHDVVLLRRHCKAPPAPATTPSS